MLNAEAGCSTGDDGGEPGLSCHLLWRCFGPRLLKFDWMASSKVG